MQDACYSGPGAFAAASLWRRRTGASEQRVAEVARDLQASPDARVLVGLGAPLGWPAALPWPQSTADLGFQVAAETRERLLLALRRIGDRLAPIATFLDEMIGGRIGDGREPFGFLDERPPPPRAEVDAIAKIADGPHAGGTYWFAVRFQQDRFRFDALPERSRLEAMGRTRSGEPLGSAPPEAHTRVVAPYGSRMVRRSFPFRSWSEEGLFFSAIASSPDSLLDAAVAMERGRDRLLPYARPVAASLFLAPGSF